VMELGPKHAIHSVRARQKPCSILSHRAFEQGMLQPTVGLPGLGLPARLFGPPGGWPVSVPPGRVWRSNCDYATACWSAMTPKNRVPISFRWNPNELSVVSIRDMEVLCVQVLSEISANAFLALARLNQAVKLHRAAYTIKASFCVGSSPANHFIITAISFMSS